MGNRRKARECALKILFQEDFTHQDLNAVLPLYWESDASAPEVKEFTEELCIGVQKNLKEIDALLEEYSTNWKLERMAAVDRNILRLGVFELRYEDKIPHSVTINEAVEIAKKFGTEESAGFINGILDKIAKEKC